MDPPRAGSDKAFLSSMVKMGPEKVVYVSCNPETLARDLKYLIDNENVALSRDKILNTVWNYDYYVFVLESKVELDNDVLFRIIYGIK